jgi:hypothetical protein
MRWRGVRFDDHRPIWTIDAKTCREKLEAAVCVICIPD